jgi:type III pantothenate kinase
MILCLDIGNTHIFGGIFDEQKLLVTFRYPSKNMCTSDQFGLFLKSFLREHELPAQNIKAISLSSVVPSIDYTITSACMKYFNISPILLKPGLKTGLKLSVKSPTSIGADRIANAVAAVQKFPDQNIIILDFGTATTVCAVSATKEYLGGAILPGIRVCMESLYNFTAKLTPVEILNPRFALGKTTEHSVQSGLFYSQVGTCREIIHRIKREAQFHENTKIIGTGGYALLFEEEDIFSENIPDLVLHGLRIVYEKNREYVVS